MSDLQASISNKDNWIEAEIEALNNATRMLQDAGQTVLHNTQPDALAEMQTYPPSARLPFEFATPKSKRWYFAAINGKIPGVVIPTDGKRYQRTGGFADSMFFEGESIEGGFQFRAGSSFSKAKFIVGDFETPGGQQVAGHRNTHWPKLYYTIERRFDEVDKEMDASLTEAHDQYVRSRSNT